MYLLPIGMIWPVTASKPFWSSSHPPFSALPVILEHFSLASRHDVSFTSRGARQTLEEEGTFLSGSGVLLSRQHGEHSAVLTSG